MAVFLALAYGVTFTVLSLLRHASFNTHAFDLGIMHHVTWNTMHGRWFQYTYMLGFRSGLTNYLGDHVRLILVPLSWLYRLHEGPETLLVTQALAVGSGAVPLYLLGRRWLRRDVPALLFASLFLVHPAVQAANLFDFHPIVMASSFLLWAIYFAESGHAAGLAVAIALILGCKENMALVVALLGIYQLLRRRLRSGAVLSAVGCTWFLICYYVIPRAFGVTDQPTSFSRYSYLGAGPGELVRFLFTNPSWVVQRLTEPHTLEYFKGLLIPLGGLSLFAPQVLLIAASEIGLNLLSSFPLQRTIDYQYAPVVVAVATTAALRSVCLIHSLLARKLRVPRKTSLALLSVLPLVASFGYQYKVWRTVRFFSARYRQTYTITDHDRLASRFFEQIPPEAPLSAQSDLTPHVSQRPRIYLFPVVEDAQYVLLDTTTDTFPVFMFPIDDLSPDDSYREYIRRLLQDGDFHVEDYDDGWILMARGPDGGVGLPVELAAFLAE